MVKVEVIYIDAAQVLFQREWAVPEGSSVEDVLQESGVYDAHPEAVGLPMGIYSKPVALERLVTSGDRIEIYRPLSLDPKERRRVKAKVNRVRRG